MTDSAVGGGVFEVGFGGETHLILLGCSDGIKTVAVDSGFAVFDFSEVDVVVFGGDEVDFVKVGFVVSGDNGVTVVL